MNIGGPARQALLLTKELAEEFPTTLAAGTPQPGEGELGDPDVVVSRVPLVRPINPSRDARSVREVRKLLASDRSALIHTHMAKAGTVGRLAAATMSDRPRTVHTFHGHVLDGYFSAPVQRAFVLFERWIARRTDVLVAVSAEIRDQLLDLGVGRERQYEVIPLGFDLSSFLRVEGHSGGLRDELGLDDRAPLVGVLGRLAPIKDHETLLLAIAALEGVHLAVAGEGELSSVLRRRASELGIEGRVHFIGWRHDVAEVLSDMDVVALTSRNEGSPVSLIEALASGRPVVATDVGGVRSVVREGESGFLVPAGDVRAVSDKLSLLLQDAKLRSRLGRRGREDIESRYGKDRLVADIRRLYEGLIR